MAGSGGTRFVFVLGVGRCGSTLVHQVLARHPDVGFLSNLQDRLPSLPLKGRWNNAVYRRVPPWLTEKGRVRFAPSEGYRVLGRRVSPMLVAPLRDLGADDAAPWLARRLRRFFEERAAAQGKPVFLHKFTGWPRAGLLSRVFPEARFVHVVRDGRAVAASLVQQAWWRGFEGPEAWTFGPLPEADRRAWEETGRSFVVLAGLQWKLLMEAFDVARAAVPEGAWTEVRYEDLLSAPRERTGELLRFLGLSWSTAFERGFRRHRFDAGRAQGFRRELTTRDVALLEGVLGPTLARHGYPVRQGAGERARLVGAGGGSA